MAPTLQREIANHLNGQWLSTIPFFHVSNEKECQDFVAAVSLLLSPCAFPPKDIMCTVGQSAKYLHVITKGIATHAGSGMRSMLREGDHCGEEMIMNTGVYARTVRTITYVHTHRLTRTDMFECLEENPHRFVLSTEAFN